MSALDKEFFQRPLSPAEEEQLAAELASSDEACLEFAQAAEADYRRSGFPEPQLPARLSRKAWALLALLAVGTASGAWLLSDGERPVEPVQAQDQALPLHEEQAPVKAAPMTEAPGALAPDRLDVRRYDSDFVLSVTTERAGKATIQLQSLDGRSLRTLYQGRLEKGRWAIRWDGAGADGQVLVPGRYRLVLRRGEGRELGKLVQVEAR